MRSPSEWRSRSARSVTRRATLVGCGASGWRRAKASSCWVRRAPRSAAAAAALQARQHRRIGVHRTLHQVEVRLDDLQDVVEVVRHAAGELAGRLHLLALPQRRLVAQLLGDVDAANDRAAARHLAARDLVVAAVIRDAHRQRAAGCLDAELQRLEQRAHRRQAVREQLIARQRRLLRRIPARKADERLVPGDDLAVGVDHEDRVLKAFQRRLQAAGIDHPARAAPLPGGWRRARRCTCRRSGTGTRRP